MAQSLPHLRKQQLRLIAQTEKRLGATQFFTRRGYPQHLFWSHGVCARFTGIAPEDAISAVISAKVRERNEAFARIGDHPGFEAVRRCARSRQKLGKFVITAAHEPVSC